jgi:hypothetical protein
VFKLKLTLVMLLSLVVAGIIFSLEERQPSKEEQALMKQTKLTLEEAKQIALKEAPGKVFDWELEKEDGKIVYAIQIQVPDDNKYSREVLVDANSGKIVEVEKENLQDNLRKAKNVKREAEDDKDQDKEDAEDQD